MHLPLSPAEMTRPASPPARAARLGRLAAAVLVPSLLTLILLWLPFGFGMMGHIEEWGLLGLYNTYGALPFITVDGPLAAHAVRPLMSLPFWGSYALSPDSFVAWHWILLAGLLVKGCSAALLAYYATRSLRWAAVFGPLLLLYPADTMQLSFRSQHINWSIALSLLAVVILLFAVERCKPRARHGLAALAAVLLLLACGMYEAALTLAPVPLLIVLVRNGLSGTWRWLRSHYADLALLWSGALVYVIYAAWVASHGSSYQSAIAGGKRSALAVLIESLPNLFSIGYARLFFGGWRDAVAIIRTEFASYAYLAHVSLLLAGALFVVWRRFAPRTEVERPDVAIRMLVVGLLAAALGYAPFLLLPSHMEISQRTFLWATPGAALVCLALLMLLGRAQRWLGFGAAILCLCAGLGAQLFQFHHYNNIAQLQQALLRAIVTNVDGNLQGKTLLVLDESNSLGHTWAFPENHLKAALTYVYGHDFGPVEVCHMPSAEWQHADGLSRKGSCVQETDGWKLSPASAVSGPGYAAGPLAEPLRLAAASTVVVTIKPDYSGVLTSTSGGWQQPLALQDNTAARRLRGALAPADARQWRMFADQFPSARYRWSFGDWWSLELPIRGSGWREAGWEAVGTDHVSRAWKLAPSGTLDFVLAPQTRPYRLRGQFGTFASETVRQNLGMLINGNKLSVSLAADGRFESDIDPAFLKPGLNRLTVQAPVNDEYFGLSVQLDWFEVLPN